MRSIETPRAEFIVKVICVFGVITTERAETLHEKPAAPKQQVLWEKLGAEIRDIDSKLDGVMGVA